MLLLTALMIRFFAIAQLCLNLDFTSFFGLCVFLLSVADLPWRLLDAWSHLCCFKHSCCMSCFRRFRSKRSRRGLRFAGRFVGHRRFSRPRRLRRRCSRVRFFIAKRLFLLALVCALLFCGRCSWRHIANQLGLLATRVGEASHPGPAAVQSSSATPVPDACAAFLNERARAASQPQSKSNLRAPSRSPWTSCSIDLTQLDFTSRAEPLSMISPDAFTENATGVVMLTRPMFSSVSKVRSKHALLVVLPGAKNDELAGLKLSSSSFASHWMFLRDPLHRKWSRRLVTLVQRGAVAVLPHKLDECPAWDVSSHLSSPLC